MTKLGPTVMEEKFMDDPFGKIVDILIAVILLFIFPLLYFGQRTDSITQQVVTSKTAEFVDTIRTQGYLSKNMYKTFLEQLGTTNNIYDIQLEHKELALEPEYRLKTPEEVIGEQDRIWNGQNIYHYHPIETELPKIEDPIFTIGLNTETNESVLAHAVNSPADPSHEHTEDCYRGHRHGDGTCNHTPTQAGYWGWHEEAVYGNSHHFITCKDCGTVLADAHEYAQYENDMKTVVYFEAATGGERLEIPAYYWDTTNGWKAYEGYDEWYAIVDIIGKIKNNQPYDLSKTHLKGCYYCGTGIVEYTIHRHKEALSYHNNSDQYRPNDCFSTSQLDSIGGSYTVGGVTISDSRSNYVTYTVWRNGKKLIDKHTYLTMLSCPDDNFRAFQLGFYGNIFKISDIEHMTLDRTRRRSGGGYFDDYDIYLAGSSKANAVDEGIIGGPNGGIGRAHHVHLKCGKTDGQITYKCGLGEDTTADCSSVVISISPTHPIQKVYFNEPLITTAIATFLDGSTKIVVCSADFEPNTIVTDKTVTLSYYGSLDGKPTGPFTCKIQVTVIPKTKSCLNGHTYNLNSEGTDPGCPYCKGWLKSLEVITPKNREITIYRATSLIDNGVVLLATYLNGRKEILYSGYVDNLDAYYVGTQNVTISYKGRSTTLKVNIKRNLKKCDVCGKYYELYPDDTDPGCPFCKALIPVFTGTVLKYYKKTYSEEIIKILFEDTEVYYFTTGDYLSIMVTSQNDTIGTKLLGFVQPHKPPEGIHVEYSGSIRDETKALKEER